MQYRSREPSCQSGERRGELHIRTIPIRYPDGDKCDASAWIRVDLEPRDPCGVAEGRRMIMFFLLLLVLSQKEAVGSSHVVLPYIISHVWDATRAQWLVET